MVAPSDLECGHPRLLMVDNAPLLPVGVETRLLVTGGDVLHSFAVPSLAIKVDAVPGRLNQASLSINRNGLFFGQCSEICGANHSFMPIMMGGVSLQGYVSWLSAM